MKIIYIFQPKYIFATHVIDMRVNCSRAFVGSRIPFCPAHCCYHYLIPAAVDADDAIDADDNYRDSVDDHADAREEPV